MEWNHPYFASPSPAADGQTRWPWLGPGRSLVWAPRAPYREHVGPNRSRKLCGAFESCLENPVIFCVIEAGNFHSVEELYKKKKDIGSFQRKNAFSISQKESGGVTFWGKERGCYRERLLRYQKFYFWAVGPWMLLYSNYIHSLHNILKACHT